ncbi:MAG: GH116 family glycosyl hydrolase [Anaerolineae bacterium]|nr:GH116 family glycosyl hydrolase [Anaerolineae bacterium]
MACAPRNAYQQTLWTGSYYRLWNDVAHGRASDVSLGNQLMAQWCVRVAGLPDALPPENVQAALGMVERLNMGATPHGLVNGVTPDGQRYDARAEIMADVSNLNDDDQASTFSSARTCAPR